MQALVFSVSTALICIQPWSLEDVTRPAAHLNLKILHLLPVPWCYKPPHLVTAQSVPLSKSSSTWNLFSFFRLPSLLSVVCPFCFLSRGWAAPISWWLWRFQMVLGLAWDSWAWLSPPAPKQNTKELGRRSNENWPTKQNTRCELGWEHTLPSVLSFFPAGWQPQGDPVWSSLHAAAGHGGQVQRSVRLAARPRAGGSLLHPLW